MKMLSTKKGFTISDMSGIGIAFVVTAIVLAIGATILASMQASQTSGSAAYNQSGYGLQALSTIGSYMPTIALVAVAAVVVGIVLVYLAGKR